jgi:DNA modification methylase
VSLEYRIGDVFDELAKIPTDSIDMLCTSPPFLALRSYLPADHPDKGREIGSEATPAAFLDTLLALTSEWGRVLAPHGSLCVELGDTYSGSGGAGGDYNADGLRAGQDKFDGSGRRTRAPRESSWSYTDAQWLAALVDAEGAIYVGCDTRDENTRYTAGLAVGMNHRAMLDKAQHITGLGAVTQSKQGYKWSVFAQQARYVLLNIWPYLLVKQDQAKAAIELARSIEDGKCGRGKPVTQEDLAYRESIRLFVMNLNEKGGNHGKFPNDWVPPTPPSPRHVHWGQGSGWPASKSLTGIPTLYPWSLAYGRNLLTGGFSPAGRWRIRNVIVWARPNPPVGALGDKFRPATSYITVACRGTKQFFDLDAVRTPLTEPDAVKTHSAVQHNPMSGWEANISLIVQNPAGAPPLDWHQDEDGDWLWKLSTQPYRGAHYATFPLELPTRLIMAMCPLRVCVECGRPSERITAVDYEAHGVKNPNEPRLVGADAMVNGSAQGMTHGRATKTVETLGWSDCGHNTWRTGNVLDPFAGSGTTLQAAQNVGRHAIGIDLDPRCAELAQQRVGLFLEVQP